LNSCRHPRLLIRRFYCGYVFLGKFTGKVSFDHMIYPRMENGGQNTFSGDNATVVFNIPHYLGEGVAPITPNVFWAEPLTTVARANHLLSSDATNIIVTFDVAPPAGVDNIKFSWYAKYDASLYA